MTARLILTMGDPSGIGPEVLLLALSRLRSKASIAVVGDLARLKSTSRRLGLKIPWENFRCIDCGNCPRNLTAGRVQAAGGRAAVAYLKEAVRILREGQADALVTAPVSKEAIVKAGIRWIGHTEFLARGFRCPTAMLFVVKKFRVSLVTTHVALRKCPRQLTKGRVIQTIRMTRESLVRDFGISRPRIGVAALNPHGGEGGLFGEEEERILRPAVQSFETGGVEGPFPVDSLMLAASRGAYDAVVALYHDQALIPVKLVGWEEAVNVTLGLPFVRTSPVHGTAFDLAGAGRADPSSMRAAIKLAIQLALHRKNLCNV